MQQFFMFDGNFDCNLDDNDYLKNQEYLMLKDVFKNYSYYLGNKNLDIYDIINQICSEFVYYYKDCLINNEVDEFGNEIYILFDHIGINKKIKTVKEGGREILPTLNLLCIYLYEKINANEEFNIILKNNSYIKFVEDYNLNINNLIKKIDNEIQYLNVNQEELQKMLKFLLNNTLIKVIRKQTVFEKKLNILFM